MRQRDSNETFSLQCAPRIAEERLRLGLSQQEIGERCGVSRIIWGKYERGQVIPGGDILLSLSKLGMDVLYILTGQRTSVPAVPAVPEVPVAANEPEIESKLELKPDEDALLDNYRNSPESSKQNMQAVSFAFAQQANTQISTQIKIA